MSHVRGLAQSTPYIAARRLHAALPVGLIAAAFLALAVRQLALPYARLPGAEVLYRWWLLEVTAIWFTPGISAVLGLRVGRRLLRRGLPLLTLAALAGGLLTHSTKLFGVGTLLSLLLVKCGSLDWSSNSPRARELFRLRVLVGGLAGAASVVATAVVLLAAREIFELATLRGSGVARGASLLGAAFYFASLCALELILRPDTRTPAARPAQRGAVNRQRRSLETCSGAR